MCAPSFSGSLSITKSQPTETESAHGGRRVSRSSGDSSIPSPKATQVEGVPAVPFSTDSALVLRHFGLHDVTLGPPSIARNAHPTNVTASLGRTARLRCRILNLAQKSVRVKSDFSLRLTNFNTSPHDSPSTALSVTQSFSVSTRYHPE